MVNYAEGNMGANPQLNPWSPNNGAFQSLGGMYHLGGMNDYAPSHRTMFGADAQMYYAQMDPTPAMQRYKAQEFAMQDMGLGKFIKHQVLGNPLALGVNSTSMDVAFKEQSDLFYSHLGFTAGEIGANAAGGLAGVYSKTLMGGLATGAAGMGVGALVGAAADQYFENYRNTSEIAGVTNKFIGQDGQLGFSANDTSDFAQFLSQEAADDPLLDMQDMINVTKMASSAGMLSETSSLAGAKRSTKKLTKTLKDIADLMGSSDLKALMSEMKKYSMLGFSQQGTTDIMSKLNFGADIAGVSRSMVNDFNNSAMMASGSQSRTAGSIAHNVASDVREMTSLQSMIGTNGSGRLNDTGTYLSTAEELNRKAGENLSRTVNVTSDKKKLYARHRSDRTGESLELSLKKLEEMAPSEQSSEMFAEGTRGDDKAKNMSYNRALSNATYAKSVVESDKTLSSMETERERHILQRKILNTIKKDGGIATDSRIRMAINDTGIQLSSVGMEMMIAETKIRANPVLQKEMDDKTKSTKQAVERRTVDTKNRDKAEKNYLGYRVQQAWGNLGHEISTTIGGFNAAAKTNEHALMQYGSRTINERKRDSHFLSSLGIEAKTDNMFMGNTEESRKQISKMKIEKKEGMPAFSLKDMTWDNRRVVGKHTDETYGQYQEGMTGKGNRLLESHRGFITKEVTKGLNIKSDRKGFDELEIDEKKFAQAFVLEAKKMDKTISTGRAEGLYMAYRDGETERFKKAQKYEREVDFTHGTVSEETIDRAGEIMGKVSAKTDEERARDKRAYARLKMKDTFDIMRALEDDDEVKANHLIAESGIDIDEISKIADKHGSAAVNDALVEIKDQRAHVGHNAVKSDIFSKEDSESQEAFMQMFHSMAKLSDGDTDKADALKAISDKVMKGELEDKYDIADAISKIKGMDVTTDEALDAAGKMMTAEDKASSSWFTGPDKDEIANSAQFHYNEKVKNGMLYNRNRRKEMLSAQIGSEAAELFVQGEETGKFATAEGKQDIMDKIRKMEGNSGVTFSSLEELSRSGKLTAEQKEKAEDKKAEDRMAEVEANKASIKSEQHLSEMLKIAQEGQ